MYRYNRVSKSKNQQQKSSQSRPRKVVLYLPEGFYAAVFVKPNWVPAASWFVHKLYTARIFDRRLKTSYIQLVAKHLRNIMPGRDYANIIRALIAAGVVESDGQWIVDLKAKGYRLTEQYRNQTHRRTVLAPSRATTTLGRKLKRHRRQCLRATSRVQKHLQRNLKRLTILDHTFRVSRKSATAAAMIKDKEWFFRPDKYGRVHHNASNLHKRLRSLLRFQGKALVNVDIRNSQPLFLALMYQNFSSSGDNYFQPFRTFQRASVDSSSVHQDTNVITVNPSIIEREEGKGILYPLPCDINTYKSLCEEGVFYEFLVKIAKLQSRDEAKDMFYKCIFGPNERTRFKTEALKELIQRTTNALNEHFPTLMAFCREIKRDFYKHLSRNLQRQESQFVIDRVCLRLMDEHPNAFILTIHDSILTTPENVDLVRQTFFEEFAHYGVTPKLNTHA